MPERVQLKRTKGWRMPPNTVKVDRTTGYGNPFPVKNCRDAQDSVDRFRNHLESIIDEPSVRANIERLRGKNLACWCKITSPDEYVPCHADVLLSIANDIPLDEVIRENYRRAKGKAM